MNTLQFVVHKYSKASKCTGKLKTFKNISTQRPILNIEHIHQPDTHAIEVNK